MKLLTVLLCISFAWCLSCIPGKQGPVLEWETDTSIDQYKPFGDQVPMSVGDELPAYYTELPDDFGGLAWFEDYIDLFNGPVNYFEDQDPPSIPNITRHKLEHDFTDVNGDPAPFAPGYPKLWGSEDQQILLPASPSSIALNHDQDLLAVAIDTSIFFYNLTTLEPVQVLKVSGVMLGKVAFQPKPGSTKLITAYIGIPPTYQQEVRVWDLEEEKHKNRSESEAALLNAASVAVDSAAKELETNAGWSADDVEFAELHTTFIQSVRLGQRKIDIKNRDILLGSVFYIKSATFAAEGSLLLYSDSGIRVLGADIEESVQPPVKVSFEGFDGYIFAINTNTNGSVLATSAYARSPDIGLWDVESGRKIKTLKDPDQPTGHIFYSVAFSPDGRYVAAGSTEKSVRLWRIDTGEMVHKINDFTNYVRAIEFSPDGRYLAAGSGAMLMVVDLEDDSGANGQLWKAQMEDPFDLFFLEVTNHVFTKENILLFTTMEGVVYGFDLKTKQKLQFAPEQDVGMGLLPSFVVADDGKKLLVADQDNVLRIYNL